MGSSTESDIVRNAAVRTPVGERLLGLGPWLIVVSIAVDVAALILGLTARVGAQQFAVQPPISPVAGVALSVSYAVVGAILTARLPRNPVGWLLTLVGMFSALTIFGWYYAAYAYATVEPLLPAPNLVTWFCVSFGSPAYLGALIVLLTVFPDGRTLPGRWSRLPIVIAVTAIGSAVATAFSPGWVTYFAGVPKPFVVAGAAGDILAAARVVTTVIAAGVVAAAAASLFARYRQSTMLERAQLRWIAYAAVINALVAIPAFLIYAGAETALFRPGSVLGVVLWLLFASGAALIPVACLFAITRYRLYSIDRIISNTFVYAALVAILAGLYAGLNDLLKRVFVAVTGQQSDAAIVITTLILATTLTPVRQRLERVAGSRLKPVTDGAASTPPAPDPVLVEAIAQRAAELAADRVVERLATRRRAATPRSGRRARG